MDQNSSTILKLIKTLYTNRINISEKKPSNEIVSFSGKELINFMLKNHNENNLDRKEMILFIREQLANPQKTTRFVYPLEHTNKFDCGRKKFIFLPDYLLFLGKDSKVLNIDGDFIKQKNIELRTSLAKDETPKSEVERKPTYFFENSFSSIEALNNMEILVNEIQWTMLRIKGKTIDPETFSVDYSKIPDLKDFKEDFQILVRLLPFVDLKSLVISKKVNIAFFINLYNILTIHSLVSWKALKGRLTMTDWERTDYFNLFKYCIGGYLFSLNDIEHGILRAEDNFGNSKMRVVFAGLFTDSFSDTSRKRFDKHDGRKQLVLTSNKIGKFKNFKRFF